MGWDLRCMLCGNHSNNTCAMGICHYWFPLTWLVYVRRATGTRGLFFCSALEHSVARIFQQLPAYFRTIFLYSSHFSPTPSEQCGILWTTWTLFRFLYFKTYFPFPSFRSSDDRRDGGRPPPVGGRRGRPHAAAGGAPVPCRTVTSVRIRHTGYSNPLGHFF